MSTTDLAQDIAATILEGFDKHYRLFRETSAKAKERWDRRDWAAVRKAWQDRIDMYDQRVLEATASLATHAARSRAHDDTLWPQIKIAYIGLLYSREHKQPECAETFFNSVARRVLDRRYYSAEHIFRRPAISTEHLDGTEPTYRCYYPPSADIRRTIFDILHSFGIVSGWQDAARDATRIAKALGPFEPQHNFQIQVLRSLFYRNKSAYVVGRVLNGHALLPFTVPLAHDDFGDVYADAVITDAKNLGRVFSLGRAYFMVDMEVPSAYVAFLESLVPQKPHAELYTMVGLQKQGKTLFFRDLEQHLMHSSDRFVIAPGTRGMVMTVFTLPSFPYVFKIIRDWFPPPKDTDRAHVEDRYEMVKKADRVGRMADTLEYAYVAFPSERFAPGVVEELEKVAASSIARVGDRVVIEHLYTERRLVPLDLWLASADEARMREAIDEYGHAVKDLAGANVFPGDLLLKNFGVTRYGRVVFYDYDELVPLTDCHFRALPQSRDDADEMSAEPWFNVEPGDVFPEQFPQFLFPPGRAREIFMELHGDLADPKFWTRQQERLRAGIQEDLYPYAQELRFGKDPPPAT
jgi:isocitrate dehydrogenase kinase/phosphatase